MSTFKTEDKDYLPVQAGKARALRKEAFEAFNPSVLGLGDVTQEAHRISAIAAVFDLEGFTTFSSQSDPEYSIPKYLSEFLDWIFEAVRNETQRKAHDESVVLWHDLPFLAKFMGDGVLFLWNTENISLIGQHNLITSMWTICSKYSTLYSKMRRKVADAPKKLRCGVAKGSVFSVGTGEDYVGPCINMAARIQKMPGISFAFNQRGFDPETLWKNDNLKYWVLKEVSIRGIGSSELIYLRKSEYDSLSPTDKKTYTNLE